MINLFLKFLIIFTIIFNINSYAFSTNYDKYKIKQENIFMSSNNDIYNQISISADTHKNQESFNFSQLIGSSILSMLLVYPATLLINNLIFGLGGLITTLIVITLYLLTNAVVVLYFKKDKSNANYALTFIGSLTGYITFMFLNNSIIIAESLVDPDSPRSSYSDMRVQLLVNAFLVPVFTSLGGMIIGELEDKNDTEFSEKDKKIIMENYLAFSEKIKVSNGFLKFNIGQF